MFKVRDDFYFKLFYHITGLGIQNCWETLFIKKKKEKKKWISFCF